jgi:hypothetical protein
MGPTEAAVAICWRSRRARRQYRFALKQNDARVSRLVPIFSTMDVVKVMRELERAWACALPGREVVERDAVLRALRRDQRRRRQPIVSAPAARLRLV